MHLLLATRDATAHEIETYRNLLVPKGTSRRPCDAIRRSVKTRGRRDKASRLIKLRNIEKRGRDVQHCLSMAPIKPLMHTRGEQT